MKPATRLFPNSIGLALGGGAFAFYCGWNLWWLTQGRLPASIALGLFGIPVPTTGLTRALIALAEGDLAGSLWWNPISMPLLLLVIHGFHRMVQMWRGRGRTLERRWLCAWAVTLGTGWLWKLWQGPAAW